eukprot:5463477-Amphidinium_carterae.1
MVINTSHPLTRHTNCIHTSHFHTPLHQVFGPQLMGEKTPKPVGRSLPTTPSLTTATIVAAAKSSNGHNYHYHH